MATVMICPNCRVQLSPTVAVTCPLLSPSMTHSEACQRCKTSQSTSSTPTSCGVSGGMVSHFQFPYVCRHFLQVSGTATPACSHGHTCSPVLQNNSHLTVCRRSSEDTSRPTSLESPSTFQVNGVCNGSVNDFTGVSSRSGSPDNPLIFPDLLFSFAGVPCGPLPKDVWSSEDDRRVMTTSMEALRVSGWYYGSLTWQQAAAALANKAEGTFLVRDSSSQRCPFALSVKTPEGPTSVRIEYERGKFWLDCEKKGVTPQLGGVIELVQYYRKFAVTNERNSSQESSHTNGRHVWVDHKGRVFSPIRVVTPLLKRPASLRHLCRLALNSTNIPKSQMNNLPSTLISYIEKYPHTL